MAYPLQSMLKIRVMREDKAASDLTRARFARAQAARVHEEKQETLRRYLVTKEERRDRVYDAVMGRPVKIEALDLARDAVNRIDEEGLLLEEDEKKAEHELEARTKDADAAHVRYVAAEKNKEKIVLHRDVWSEEDRREQERLADAEMEEFTGRKASDEA